MRVNINKIVLGNIIACICFITVGCFLCYSAEREAPLRTVTPKKITSSAGPQHKIMKMNMNKLRQTMPFSYYQAIIIRNMFFKKTQPQPAEVKGDTALFLPEEKIEPFAYKGSVLVGGKRLVAIEARKTKEVLFMDKGGLIEGYKVMEITDKEIVLFKEGEEEIRLNTIQE